jgi:hypothetical protein
MSAFEWTEAELSDDAKAILAYARRWGEPFSRMEIVDIAPGAAWNASWPYPRTIAKLDPIRELLCAGLIEVAETRRAQGRRGNAYKLYRLTDSPRSLTQLLDVLTEAVGISDVSDRDLAERTRAEILERFGRR